MDKGSEVPLFFQPAKRSRKQNSKTVKTEKPAPTTMVLTDLPNEILVSAFYAF